MRENLKMTGEAWQLSHCHDLMSVWEKALKYFRQALSLHTEKRRQEREQLWRYGEEDSFDESAIAEEKDLLGSNTPYSLVDVNLMMADVILSSKDMANPETREKFVRVLLKEDASVELPGLFIQGGSLPWEWGDVAEIISSTRDSLNILTRKLSYIRHSDTLYRDSMHHIRQYVDEFNRLFGRHNQKWSKRIESPGASPKEKLNLIRRTLQAGMTNSFGWLSRMKIRKADIKDYSKYLNMMIEVSKEAGEDLQVEDKVSYINVTFGARLHNVRNCILSYDLVRQFCNELVVDEVKVRATYLVVLCVRRSIKSSTAFLCFLGQVGNRSVFMPSKRMGFLSLRRTVLKRRKGEMLSIFLFMYLLLERRVVMPILRSSAGPGALLLLPDALLATPDERGRL